MTLGAVLTVVLSMVLATKQERLKVLRTSPLFGNLPE
jgi:hypothetical protein